MFFQGPECQKLIAEAWEHHALKAVGRKGLTDTPRTKQRRRSCSFKVRGRFPASCLLLLLLLLLMVVVFVPRMCPHVSSLTSLRLSCAKTAAELALYVPSVP